MINYIKGILAYKGENAIIVETSGIGYNINVPTNSPFYLKEVNETIKVYTVMIVREDDMSLYGFENMEELDIFKKLIGINGVGAKAGLAIFSAMSANEIKRAVILEDHAQFTMANGIGKKTAQRIVLDLKDKFKDYIADDEKATIGENRAFAHGIENEAIEALVGLGYSRIEASSAISKVSGDTATVEECIKQALKNI